MNHAVGRGRSVGRREEEKILQQSVEFLSLACLPASLPPSLSLLKRRTERPLLFCGAKVSFTFNSAGRGERARDSAAEEAIERADADDRTQLKAER